jgi:hypothetical protein
VHTEIKARHVFLIFYQDKSKLFLLLRKAAEFLPYRVLRKACKNFYVIEKEQAKRKYQSKCSLLHQKAGKTLTVPCERRADINNDKKN